MSKKYSQEDLNKVLDTLHEGLIGSRKEFQWDASFRMQDTWSNEEMQSIMVANRNNTDGYKSTRGVRHSINSTKVEVYKGDKVGNARWGNLDLVNVEYFGTFDSMNEAAKSTGVTTAAVSACISGKIRFARGYIFKKVK